MPAIAREVHPDGFQPGRRTVRNPLLVHLLARHSRREAVHHAGPLPQRTHDAIADRQVVADEIELGFAAGGEVHPVRAGDANRPVPDLEFHVFCGHTQKSTAIRAAVRRA